MPRPPWKDGSAGGTPLSAAVLNEMEADIAARLKQHTPAATVVRARQGAADPTPATTDALPYTFGLRFTAKVASRLTEIAFWLTDRTYDDKSITVGAWDGAGALLHSGTVPITATTPLGWVTYTIPSGGLTLAAGTTYTVGWHAQPASDGKSHYANPYARWAAGLDIEPFTIKADGSVFAYNSANLTRPQSANAQGNGYGVDFTVTYDRAGDGPMGTVFYDATTLNKPRPAGYAAVWWIATDGTQTRPTNAILGDPVSVR